MKVVYKDAVIIRGLWIKLRKLKDYIIVEVSIVRFNRIGSEGTKSHAVEGESRSFLDSDFDEYKEDIQAYKESKNIDRAKGGILWA